jgi:hypothetical protein
VFFVIRGNVRHNIVRCIGEAGHSGAVPRWLRKDAVFATADLVMRLDEHRPRNNCFRHKESPVQMSNDQFLSASTLTNQRRAQIRCGLRESEVEKN